MSSPRRPRPRRSRSELSAMPCNSPMTNLGMMSCPSKTSRLHHVGDPPVDHHAGVENAGLQPLDFLGELDVGNDEAEVVLGLHQQADADVAQHKSQHQLHADCGVCPNGIAKGTSARPRAVRQEQADDHAEVDGRDRVEAFLADGAHPGRSRPRATSIMPPKPPRQASRAARRIPANARLDKRHAQAGRHQNEHAAQDN